MKPFSSTHTKISSVSGLCYYLKVSGLCPSTRKVTECTRTEPLQVAIIFSGSNCWGLLSAKKYTPLFVFSETPTYNGLVQLIGERCSCRFTSMESLSHGPNIYKTSNPLCRLYWCLINFIDWRYSQSCWYFRPLLWTFAPPTFSLIHLLHLPPPSLCEQVQGVHVIHTV